MSARRQAKELVKESKRLARKSSTLTDERRTELSAAQAAVEQALRDKMDLTESVNALDEKVTAWLSHLRKGRFREYVESIGIAVLFALTVRAFGFEAFQIPSPSMLPTLLVGDHLFVAKTSYGLRVPFTTNYLARWSDVEAGDVIVFEFPALEVATQQAIQSVDIQVERYASRFGGYPATLDDAGVSASASTDAWGRAMEYAPVGEDYRLVSPGADGEFGSADDLTNGNRARLAPGCVDQASVDHTKDYIKRVVGVAGDRIRLQDNQIFINDEPIPRRELSALNNGRVFPAVEELSGEEFEVWHRGVNPDFDEIEVREGYVFVMGDNRDNSSDGRCWGQVPVSHIKGRSMFIFFSRDRNGDGSIRWSRFFDSVD
ncbi:MAG: signal peptidase I [Bradymonadia bacterium]|jgi:signal peptidase I